MKTSNCIPLFYLSHLFLLFSAHHDLLFVEGFNNYEDIQRSDFPSGFFFGTATSAYQIEGGFLEDGKSLSNWDVFSHIQGTIKNGENGDICDDHYHRYLEDIDIMHSLGVNAYRFSISWARILPRGRFGEVNQAGIKFYNNIIDNLLSKGIEPFVTIHHHDFPQELEDRYLAWLSPLMEEDFVYFSKICFESFGDRVKNWISINEPNLFANMAYMWGMYPPGRCSQPLGNCSAGNSDVEPLIAMHNMLLAHAKATKLYRDHFQAKQGGWMGITVSAYMYEPFRNDVNEEEEAANRALAFNMGWMLDPLVLGDYPVEMRRYHGDELPQFTADEKMYLKGSIDFIGVNHYSTLYAKDCIHSTNCAPSDNRAIRGFVSTTGDRDGVLIGAQTGMPTFYVVPRGIKENIDYFVQRYGNIPMFITENGYASTLDESNKVEDLLHDIKRIEFVKSYLSSLATAVRNGADVRGYFAWSLMDNFEWVQGYSMKFGLCYIDHQTLNRIPKLSAKWYKDFLTNDSVSNKQATTGNLFGNKNILVPEFMEHGSITSMK